MRKSTTDLLGRAAEQLLQLFLPAPLVAGVKYVDLGLGPRCRSHLGQLTADAIVSLF